MLWFKQGLERYIHRHKSLWGVDNRLRRERNKLISARDHIIWLSLVFLFPQPCIYHSKWWRRWGVYRLFKRNVRRIKTRLKWYTGRVIGCISRRNWERQQFIGNDKISLFDLGSSLLSILEHSVPKNPGESISVNCASHVLMISLRNSSKKWKSIACSPSIRWWPIPTRCRCSVEVDLQRPFCSQPHRTLTRQWNPLLLKASLILKQQQPHKFPWASYSPSRRQRWMC